MAIKKYTYYLKSTYELLTAFKDPMLMVSVFTGLTRHSTPFEVRLRASGLRFLVRGKMDIWSLKETMVDRFYERFGSPVDAGWAVVDVGAGIGDFTIFAACSSASTKVFAYEPYAPSYTLLQENLALNQVTNVQSYNLAVAGHVGILHLDQSAGEPLQVQSSRNNDHQRDPSRDGIVPAVDLETVLADNQIDRCDLLNLDCEGAEYAILFNAEDYVLSRVDRIIMEYHDGLTEYDHNDLYRYLTGRGYQVEITPNYVHRDLGYLYAVRKTISLDG